MGNAAATPISAKECEKYGISFDEVHQFNAVVKETKQQKKGKKMDKKDIDKIHKYCIDKKRAGGSRSGSKSGSTSGSLSKLLEKQLLLDDPSIMLTEDHTSVTRSITQRSYASKSSLQAGPPMMIDLSEACRDEPSVMCDPTVCAPPKTVDC